MQLSNTLHWLSGRTLVTGLLVSGLTLGLSQESRGQTTPQRPLSWSADWALTLGSTYDNNAFRLSQGQQADLSSGDAAYTDMNEPHDLINAIELRGRFRRPGLFARRMELGLDANLDVYTFSRRNTSLALAASAAQELSKNDKLGIELSFTPSEFRRNYVIGVDANGAPRYEAGVARALGSQLEYSRELLRGKRGAPELDATFALQARRRAYADFSWRDRTELGARFGADAKVGSLGLELRASRARASHSGDAEPVVRSGGVVMMTPERDFDETELGSELSFKVAKRSRVSLSYERRTRDFIAALSQDPVYGDREDNRNTYGGALRLGLAKHTALVLGGAFEKQSTYRPGSGDTGDEEDYRRFTTFLRLDLSR